MTLDDYNSFCASLPRTTHVVQWGGAHVWKVGAKVFAIGGWDQGQQLFVTFKCSDIAYDVLKEQPGLRPAPLRRPPHVGRLSSICRLARAT